MPIVVAELRTVDVAIGFDADDLVIAGDRFQKRFVVEDPTPPDCDPADFTGFTPAFELLDAAGVVVITGTVTPTPGDATGTFTAALTAAQTTGLILAGTTVRDLAYRLRIDDGAGTIVTLFCGPLRTTLCAAAP